MSLFKRRPPISGRFYDRQPLLDPAFSPPGLITRNSSLAWLLRDDFLTDASAPLASPRTAEPGPGTLTLVQTDGQLSISSGILAFAAPSTPAWGEQGFYGAALTHAPGLTVFGRMKVTTGGVGFPFLGWGAAASVSYSAIHGIAPYLFTTSLQLINSGGVNINTGIAFSANTLVKLAVVAVETTCQVFIDTGSGWRLAWVNERAAAASIRAVMGNYDSNGEVDYVRVRQLSAPFTTDYGITTVNEATPTSGTSYTATADAIHDLTLTAPNPLADEAGLRYRYTDDDNCWKAYFNSTGAARLDSVSASVATNRISVAAVIAAAGTATIRAVCDGSLHDLHTLAGTIWTKRGGQINLSHLNTNTAIRPFVTGSWTLGALRSYPRTHAAYAEFDRT